MGARPVFPERDIRIYWKKNKQFHLLNASVETILWDIVFNSSRYRLLSKCSPFIGSGEPWNTNRVNNNPHQSQNFAAITVVSLGTSIDNILWD